MEEAIKKLQLSDAADNADLDWQEHREYLVNELRSDYNTFSRELDLNILFGSLSDLSPNSKKVKYLEGLIDYFQIEANLTYYKTILCENEFTVDLDNWIHPFWLGAAMALYGMATNPYASTQKNNDEAFRSFEAGVKFYDAYCILLQWILDLNNGKEISSSLAVAISPPKVSRLREELIKYNFNELDAVTGLGAYDLECLLNKIEEKFEYGIAMLDHLGFFDYHQKRTFQYKKEPMYKWLGLLFGVNPRKVKGNYLILTPGSTEKKNRYKSWQYIEIVKEDYLKIKSGHAPVACP